jgi:hypothetical protein
MDWLLDVDCLDHHEENHENAADPSKNFHKFLFHIFIRPTWESTPAAIFCRPVLR